MSRPADELTLGQASAYVTGVVEYLEVAGSEWKPFDPSVPVAPNIVVNRQFRLRRPRRTLVREMAIKYVNEHLMDSWGAADRERITNDIQTKTIAAACEFLRSEDCHHGEDSSSGYADVLEHHFLVPR